MDFATGSFLRGSMAGAIVGIGLTLILLNPLPSPTGPDGRYAKIIELRSLTAEGVTITTQVAVSADKPLTTEVQEELDKIVDRIILAE